MEYKKEKCLDDFIVATQVRDLISYNVENKMIKIARDKHYRGTIESVNDDVADVLLLNASTPIPDVKINTGLKLFEDEEVYVLAINGSLNNLLIDCKVLDIDLLYGVSVDNYRLIETFQDYSEWENYEVTGTISEDIVNKKYKGKSVKHSLEATSEMYVLLKSVTLDLTVFTDSEASTTSDLIGVSFYISDINSLNTTLGVNLTFFAEFGEYNYAFNDSNTTLQTGWNNLYIAKSSFTETTSPDWGSINSIGIDFYSNVGYADEYISFGLITLIKEVATGGGSVPQPLDTTDSPTFAGLTLSGLTADRVVYANGSKALTSSDVTSTSLNYLSGLDQALSTTSIVQFRDLKLYESTTNGQALLTLENRQSSSTGNNSYSQILFNAYQGAGIPSSRITWENRGNELGEILVNIGSFYANGQSFEFSLNTATKMEIDTNSNILINAADAETSAVGALTLKNGTEPTSSTADQVTIYATIDTSSTLGLRTEATVATESITPNSSLLIRVNGTLYKIPLEAQP